MKNTLKKGKVKILIYQDKKELVFYATALEFNLTISASDKDVALMELQGAMEDYINIANELKTPEILNQEVDPVLAKLWDNFISSENKKVKSPYYLISASLHSLAR